MGWTFTQTNETVKGFMDRTFAGWEGKEFKTKMLASGINKNVYYAAMESIPQDGVMAIPPSNLKDDRYLIVVDAEEEYSHLVSLGLEVPNE